MSNTIEPTEWDLPMPEEGAPEIDSPYAREVDGQPGRDGRGRRFGAGLKERWFPVAVTVACLTALYLLLTGREPGLLEMESQRAREVSSEGATQIEITNLGGFEGVQTEVTLPTGWHASVVATRGWPERDGQACVEIDVRAAGFDARVPGDEVPLVWPLAESEYPSVNRKYVIESGPKHTGTIIAEGAGCQGLDKGIPAVHDTWVQDVKLYNQSDAFGR